MGVLRIAWNLMYTYNHVRSWMDNIKMDIRGTGLKGVDLILLADYDKK